MGKSLQLLKFFIFGSPLGLIAEIVSSLTGWSRDSPFPRTVPGLNIALKDIFADKSTVRLQIWHFIELTEDLKFRGGYYRLSYPIFVFDKSDRKSFEDVKIWYDEFEQRVHQLPPRHPTLPDGYDDLRAKWKLNPPTFPPAVLIGFIDEVEEVTLDEGLTLAKSLSIPYYEAEPTDMNTVEEILHDLILQIVNK